MSNTAEPKFPKFAKTYHQLAEQLPRFLDEDPSNLEDILTVYYEYLDNNVNDAVDLLYSDIDEVDEDFVEYFVYEFAQFAQFFNQPIDDKRKLVKYAKEMYESKGTEKSFKLFFKLLFKENIDVYLPKLDVLKTSSADLSEQKRLIFNIGFSDFSSVYSTQKLKSISVLGQKLDIVKILREENYLFVFFKNDLRDLPKPPTDSEKGDFAQFIFENKRISLEVSSATNGIKENQFDLINIEGNNIFDTIEIVPKNDNQNNSAASYQITDVTKGFIESFKIYNSGSGYVTGDYLTFKEKNSEYILTIKAAPSFSEDGVLLTGKAIDSAGVERTGPYDPKIDVGDFEYLRNDQGLFPQFDQGSGELVSGTAKDSFGIERTGPYNPNAIKISFGDFETLRSNGKLPKFKEVFDQNTGEKLFAELIAGQINDNSGFPQTAPFNPNIDSSTPENENFEYLRNDSGILPEFADYDDGTGVLPELEEQEEQFDTQGRRIYTRLIVGELIDNFGTLKTGPFDPNNEAAPEDSNFEYLRNSDGEFPDFQKLNGKTLLRGSFEDSEGIERQGYYNQIDSQNEIGDFEYLKNSDDEFAEFSTDGQELILGSALDSDGTLRNSPYTIGSDDFESQKNEDGIFPNGEVIGLKCAGYRTQNPDGFRNISTQSSYESPLEISLFSEISKSILFKSIPVINDFYFNDLNQKIKSTSGTGFLTIPILFGSGKISKLDFIDFGTGLNKENTLVKAKSTLSVIDTSDIGGDPIIELFYWESAIETPAWTPTGYGGRIVNNSSSKGRITIESTPSKFSSRGNYLKPINLSINPKFNNPKTTFKIVVLDGSNGRILNEEFNYGTELKISPINVGSFDFSAVSDIKTVNSNGRNVLSSLNSVLKDKQYYHEYSYIIKSKVTGADWLKMFKESIHPAGFKVVSEIDTASDDILPSNLTVGRAIRYEKLDELFLDESNNYGFPNRITKGVEDSTRAFQGNDNALTSSVYNAYPNYVPGFKVDEELKIQYSDAFLLENRDETNGQFQRIPGSSPFIGRRIVYEINEEKFWLDALNSEDGYERYNKPKEVTKENVPAREGPFLNDLDYISSTSSLDENYWYKGWSKHSTDLYDRRNALNTIKSNENLFVFSSQTDYEGKFLNRFEVAFPNGNTPLRYKNISKQNENEYIDNLNFFNVGFPADKRRLVENKKQLDEIGNSPDRDPYIEFDDIPENDETLCTLNPNTKVGLNRGEFDFSIELDLSDASELTKRLDDSYITLEEYAFAGNNDFEIKEASDITTGYFLEKKDSTSDVIGTGFEIKIRYSLENSNYFILEIINSGVDYEAEDKIIIDRNLLSIEGFPADEDFIIELSSAKAEGPIEQADLDAATIIIPNNFEANDIAGPFIYKDTFWGYEPKGLAVENRTLQVINTSSPNETVSPSVTYNRYTTLNYSADVPAEFKKVDSWYDNSEASFNPAAFINIENDIFVKDFDESGNQIFYKKLSEVGIIEANFTDFSDDKKLKYDAISYLPTSPYKKFPRKFEVNVIRELDIQSAAINELTYEDINSNGVSITYVGLDAFNQIWKL